jgi:hypothetical protein
MKLNLTNSHSYLRIRLLSIIKKTFIFLLCTTGNTKPTKCILESKKSYTFSFCLKSPNITLFTAAKVSNQSPIQNNFKNFFWSSTVPITRSSRWQNNLVIPSSPISEVFSEEHVNNSCVQFMLRTIAHSTII